ncbi:hypothetical protein AMELA_G00016410 [Ameiurus melas]|uniref:Tripartite motif-containing protein 16-like n=1 Tax=Ameiurus melas TaxID=219545 RepID=A0A7J6BAE6_AMEME|nr:hypothetical protein AMELA_G00016410 [Ameiurus melas]
MAEASISVDQLSVDQFSCPVCLDLLKDPVTIPCGHNFCKVCINDYWDQEDKSGVYRCPQCRDTFTPRPVLRRNNMLAEVVEKLKKTEVQAASSAHCYAGLGKELKEEQMKSQQRIQEKQKKVEELKTDAAAVQIILRPEPKSREDFLQYFCDLTLDPNTVNYNLILFEKNRAVTRSETKQQYSDHPERFDYYGQVLSKESVCGRCYWEVEWSGVGVDISVSYKDIKRKGRVDECWFGLNNQSWNLQCYSSSSLFFYHNNIKTDLGVPSSSRIGVYVDHSAGSLSFYSVSDTMKLLHRVHTTFTQPLYAGFMLDCYGSTLRLCDPK